MKTQRNIFIAFILNLLFAIFEFVGGIFTNSIAIMSDAIHDLGDACSIGISYFLEKKSKSKPNNKYTYGYLRYSVIGAAFTSIILLIGSVIVIGNAINRIVNPVELNYHGMIIFAIVGVLVNFLAAYFTKDGDSLNQKAVNLHMLEDVLGWVAVLLGSIIIKFTNLTIIDPILSLAIAGYLIVHVVKNLKEIILIFSETNNIKNVSEISMWLSHVGGVKDIHHLHIWQMDEANYCATLHVVTTKPTASAKKQIKHIFEKYGINHVTVEFESENEQCPDKECNLYLNKQNSYHCGCKHNHSQDYNFTMAEQKTAVRLPQYEIEF